MPDVITFHQGLDGNTTPDKLADGFVAAGSNIDFSIELGGARVRRGSVQHATAVGGTVPLLRIARHYTDQGVNASPFYVLSTTSSAGVRLLRSTNGTATAFGTIATATGSNASFDIGFYKDWAYFVYAEMRRKDDGTNTYEWANQSPGTAPTIGTVTLTPLVVCTTYSAAEGTPGGLSGTATVTADSVTFRAQLNGTPIAADFDTNGGAAIGDHGIHYIEVWLSDPARVKRISCDYSIGDANFTNFWHYELWAEDGDIFNAFPRAPVLIDAELTSLGQVIDNDAKQLAISRARRYDRPTQSLIASARNTFHPWATPRTGFNLVGPAVTAGWSNIGKVRIVVEATAAIEVRVRNWQIFGQSTYPLTDVDVGYAFWETWARLDASNTIEWESGPSPASSRVKMQGMRATVAVNGTATGTSHGFTHRLVYGQGGKIPAPYRVGTLTGTGVGTFTHTTPDISVLIRNQPMTPNQRGSVPTNCVAISEPFYDRLFVGTANRIIWSLPGSPDAFPTTSDLTISHKGDTVRRLLTGPNNLTIVNRDSVYELTGNLFEGRAADYLLQRTAAKRGSYGDKSCIKTDYGVLLVSQDGFFLYQPGAGVDRPIEWANARLRPMWLGGGASDPAALDGNRVPAINIVRLDRAVAAYNEGRIYIGVPTGANEDCSVLIVLDMVQQRCWYYTFPWLFSSIFWDRQDNRMFVGDVTGNLYRIETGLNDVLASGTATAIPYSIRSRSWTVPSDTILENISVEHRGAGGVVTGTYDGTNAVTVDTLSGTNRTWSTPRLLGTVANNVFFQIAGNQQDALRTYYNIVYDALVEPVRILFYRTPYETNGYDGEKLWDVHFTDMEIVGTGTVLGTVFVDNTVVMTATYTGPPGGRQIFPTSYPLETFGDVTHTVYNGVIGTATTRFKLWKTTMAARPEPPRTNTWQTDYQSLDENICDGVDVDINPNGTVTQTIFVDQVAVRTNTITGTRRQSYTIAFRTVSISGELFGRTIHANYVGSAFKHYKTWWHLRPEPDRWNSFVSDRESMEEAICDGVDADIDCLSNTVLGTVMVDNVAINTFTYTGATRQSYTNAITNETYGRTVWQVYNASSGVFKHYRTWWHKRPEPDRWTNFVTDRQTMPADAYAKTVVADMNPLGTCLGTVFANSANVGTMTFIGTQRAVFNWGFPNITQGAELHVVYNAQGTGARFKHYNTSYETDSKPFLKNTWLLEYHKVGGASQLDHGRFFGMEVEAATPTGTTTITSVWDIDGTAFQTNTLTFTGRQWRDRIPLSPGGRGYLFQQRVSGATDFRVWNTTLDGIRVGVKGLSRFQIKGRPAT